MVRDDSAKRGKIVQDDGLKRGSSFRVTA